MNLLPLSAITQKKSPFPPAMYVREGGEIVFSPLTNFRIFAAKRDFSYGKPRYARRRRRTEEKGGERGEMNYATHLAWAWENLFFLFFEREFEGPFLRNGDACPVRIFCVGRRRTFGSPKKVTQDANLLSLSLLSSPARKCDNK